jgi:capsular exopolysaccharide synthesis family protein
MAKKTATKRAERVRDPLLTEASKTLLANIRFASIDDEIKTLVVTSSMVDEGKSTVALNLAIAAATSGKNTLLVDADMRRRSLAHMLGAHPRYGLYAVLSGAATLNDTIVRTPTPSLFFLDTEPNIPSPPDILGSKRFASMVEDLRKAFDYVIFDTSPVSLFVDAAILGSLVDGALFVVRQNYAKRDVAQKSIQQLYQANAHILGCVVTFTTDKENEYYYSYYTQSGRHAAKRRADSNQRSDVLNEGAPEDAS